MFSAAGGKIHTGHWSSAMGESKKLLYEQLFPHATSLFQSVRELDHDIQRLSWLSEAANAVVHCITVWQIKRRGT